MIFLFKSKAFSEREIRNTFTRVFGTCGALELTHLGQINVGHETLAVTVSHVRAHL